MKLEYKPLCFSIFAGLGVLLIVMASRDPWQTEQVFSTGFYKIYSQAISSIFSILPFSVGEVLLIVLFIGLIFRIANTIKKAIKNKSTIPVINDMFSLIGIGSCVYFVFVISCGLNYYRMDFSYYLGKEAGEYSKEELLDMTIDYIEIASELREVITEEDMKKSYLELSANANDSFEMLGELYPALSGSYSKAKPLYLISELMSYTEITGIFNPFTMEANVNVAVPHYTIPYTMLHEQAHQRGFMKENEANFIAFLAGREGEDVYTKYSAYMAAISNCLGTLSRVDTEYYYEALSHLSEEQVEDRRVKFEYWEQFEDKLVSEVFTEINDNYLKANGQEQGVVSYGEVVDLLLLDYYGK